MSMTVGDLRLLFWMVNPDFRALKPNSNWSEKCVGITLTTPGSKNLQARLF
jgi:hypothetical protein